MKGHKLKRTLLGTISTFSVVIGAAQAQTTDEADIITIIADPVGLLEERSTDTIFGVNRALVETPRSVSIISDTTIDRYAIEDIDDFITTTPGTFGGSYFGVPGAVSVRGDLGDNYFRGFKRVTNNGFFPLPVGSSSRVEIVRGPTPAIYGAGRIGGLLNFHPKTAVSEGITTQDGLTGGVSYTGGSFDKNQFTAELTIPFLVDGRESGLSIYAEYEDSEHFVRGREPQHELVQTSYTHDMGNGFSVELGGFYFNTEGYIQTAGQNRLTQEYIDNGTYTTGRDVDLVDLDGNGRITQNEADAAAGTWFFGALSCLSAFTEFVSFSPFSCGTEPFSGSPGDVYDLDEGVGTAEISLRDQLVSPFDVGEARNFIVYFDLVKEFDNNSTAKFQVYYEDNNARQGTAHGFAGDHDVDVLELRASYDFGLTPTNWAEMDFFLTASYRSYDSILKENFLSGYVVVDRVDLSVGTVGNDVFDTPFTNEPGGINTPWDTVMDSVWRDTGVALVADLKLWEDFGILFNGRYDYYDYHAIDTGTITFGPSLFTSVSGYEDAFSYSISGSFDIGNALNLGGSIVPYITYADVYNPLINAAGGISVGTIESSTNTILADSQLLEAGIKFELFDDTLFGSLAFYEQERSQLDILGNQLREESRGFEAELNWLITDNWTLTGASTVSEFKIKDPDPFNCASGSGQGEFVNIQPTDPSIAFDFNFDGVPDPIPSNVEGYGGIYRALNASCLPELADGYEKEGIPNQVHSLFLTYTSPETDYGTFGGTFGGTYVGETGTLPVANEVRFPDYLVFRLAAFAQYKNFSLIGTIDNLTDKRYFRSLQGTFQNVTVSPGEGRTWRLTASYDF